MGIPEWWAGFDAWLEVQGAGPKFSEGEVSKMERAEADDRERVAIQNAARVRKYRAEDHA